MRTAPLEELRDELRQVGVSIAWARRLAAGLNPPHVAQVGAALDGVDLVLLDLTIQVERARRGIIVHNGKA